MRTDIRQLRHIVTLADHGSFSRAANAIGISQPALSRSIANMENACGEQLFDRSASGVVPTAFAEPLVQRARSLIVAMAEFEADLELHSSGRSGRLTFGTGPLVASLSFSRVLPQIFNHGSKLEIATMIASAPDLLSAVAASRIEFAIFTASEPPPGEEFVTQSAGRIRIAYLVRPGHPLAGAGRLSLKDLAAFPLASGGAPGGGATFSSMSQANTIICENFHVLRELAAASDVVWLGSPDLLPYGSEPLVALDVEDGVGGERELACFHLRNRALSPQARHAVECFRAYLSLDQEADETGVSDFDIS